MDAAQLGLDVQDAPPAEDQATAQAPEPPYRHRENHLALCTAWGQVIRHVKRRGTERYRAAKKLNPLLLQHEPVLITYLQFGLLIVEAIRHQEAGDPSFRGQVLGGGVHRSKHIKPVPVPEVQGRPSIGQVAAAPGVQLTGRFKSCGPLEIIHLVHSDGVLLQQLQHHRVVCLSHSNVQRRPSRRSLLAIGVCGMLKHNLHERQIPLPCSDMQRSVPPTVADIHIHRKTAEAGHQENHHIRSGR
mmetsp:Transcript_110628/g.253354  ORF Transcript_110628/g.253354 Transcript_110628/m.253354 type:complete len:244 (-) Transcript_110628:166-897(-)